MFVRPQEQAGAMVGGDDLSPLKNYAGLAAQLVTTRPHGSDHQIEIGDQADDPTALFRAHQAARIVSRLRRISTQ
jgi:hypothetical protein